MPQTRAIVVALARVYGMIATCRPPRASLSDKARTEPRDLYDLWNLLDEHDIRPGELLGELTAKLELRGRKPEGLADALAVKEARLARLWKDRLSQQMSDLPEYEGVFRQLMRALRAAALP